MVHPGTGAGTKMVELLSQLTNEGNPNLSLRYLTGSLARVDTLAWPSTIHTVFLLLALALRQLPLRPAKSALVPTEEKTVVPISS